MYIIDYRLSKVLSQERIERAESKRTMASLNHLGLRSRIGRLLVATGERLAESSTSAA